MILLKNLRLSTLFQAISPRDTALIVLHYIVQIKTAKSSLVLDEKGEVEREGPEPHFSLISAQLASAMELFVNIRNRNRQRDAAKISREGLLNLYPTHRYAARTQAHFGEKKDNSYNTDSTYTLYVFRRNK